MFEVYCHTSPSGKRYVGFTSRGMAVRWRDHVKSAGQGCSYALHRAIRKYGANAFKHELLAQCDTESGAKLAEQQWIASRGTYRNGYNATLGGEGVLGIQWSDESRARAAAVRTGTRHSADTRAKMSASHAGRTGRACRAETKAKISAANRGRTPTAEHIEKNRLGNTGRMHSADERAKMSAAWTPEMRAAAAGRARARAAARKTVSNERV